MVDSCHDRPIASRTSTSIFGTVERRVALLDAVRQAVRVERLAQRLGRVVPDLVAADVLVRILRRQVEREVVEAEGPQHGQDEVEQAGDLVRHLLAGAEDVAVVLREAADPHQPVQRAGALVAVDRAELEQPQRQLAVAALPAVEDQAVHRAVHRLRVVRAVVHLHRRIHAVGVEPEVAGRLEQLARWPGGACTRTSSRPARGGAGCSPRSACGSMAPFGCHTARPPPSIDGKLSRSSSIASLRWSRLAASSSWWRWSASACFDSQAVP